MAAGVKRKRSATTPRIVLQGALKWSDHVSPTIWPRSVGIPGLPAEGRDGWTDAWTDGWTSSINRVDICFHLQTFFLSFICELQTSSLLQEHFQLSPTSNKLVQIQTQNPLNHIEFGKICPPSGSTAYERGRRHDTANSLHNSVSHFHPIQLLNLKHKHSSDPRDTKILARTQTSDTDAWKMDACIH